MALDTHTFDAWLKDRPGREMAFRVLFWLMISTFSAVTLVLSGSHPTIPFSRFTTSTWPLILLLTKPVYGLCGFALLFKDLEHSNPRVWGQSTYIGTLGGVVRRIAGDAILWLIGAWVAGWVAMLIAYFADTTHDEGFEWLPAAEGGIIFVLIFFGVLVRRAKPVLGDVLDPKLLIAIYIGPLLLYIGLVR